MRSTMIKPPLLLASPHRLPFLTGSLGLGSTAAWWLSALVQIHAGSIKAIAPAMPASLLHGPAMLFLGFTPFVFGFLLTVIPRWMSYPDLAWQHYAPVGVLLALGVTCALIGLWSAQPPLLLGGFVFRREGGFRPHDAGQPLGQAAREQAGARGWRRLSSCRRWPSSTASVAVSSATAKSPRVTAASSR